MVEVSVVSKGEECIALPPGFRFHPTDGEIIAHYLSKKVMNSSFSARAISEVNLNECEPWDLPKKAKMGEKEWYFFCRRDRKYPTGMRTNRATEAGYWKATGKDKEIYKGKGFLVGMKKTLVFYRGRAPKGEKTNWVMHEFRLEGNFSSNHLPKTAQDEWVVSRVFHKNTGVKKSEISGPARMNSSRDDLLDCTSLPHLFDPPYLNTNRPASNFTDGQAASTVLKASDGRHFAYCSTGMDDHHLHQHDQKNNYSTTHHLGNPCHTPQNSIYRTQIPLFSSQYSGYLHQDRDINSVPNFPSSGFGDPRQPILKALAATENESGLNKQCKVEQFSSTQSMVSLSQDTGLSTDLNTEISSVVSKHELGSIRSYEGQDVLSSASPAVELVEWLWNY